GRPPRTGCRSGTAGCPSAADAIRTAGSTGWSSRICRSGTATRARARRRPGRRTVGPPTAGCRGWSRRLSSIRSWSGPAFEVGRRGERFETDIFVGRTLGDETADRVMVVTTDRRESGGHGFEDARPRGLPVGQRQAQQLAPGAVLDEERPAPFQVVLRTELEQNPQVVGEFGGLHDGAGRGVGVLEVHQGGAPLTGVAVAVVGQVEAAASAQVERLDVL